MRLPSRPARLVTWLLLATLLCAIAVVLPHRHAGGTYRPDCPACHQERAIGSSSGPVAVVTLCPSPVPLGRAIDFVPLGSQCILAAHQVSPRSPPSSPFA